MRLLVPSRAALHTAGAVPMFGPHQVAKLSLYTTDFGPRKDARCILTPGVAVPASDLWTSSDVTL
jgi:hypothetical protein